MKKKEKKIYYTVGTVPKFNGKTVESGKIDTSNRWIHENSLSWFGTVTSMKKVSG